jgi:integrase
MNSLQLVSCKLVPLEARRPYALATYLFVRAGELKALDRSDVDIERGIVSIRARLDRRRYPIGKKVSAKDLHALKIERDDFHGDWSYVIRPRGQPR